MPKNATRQALAREAKSAVSRNSAKAKKQKLSPAERSQIAKDRWAKRRQFVSETNQANAAAIVVTWPETAEAPAGTPENPASPSNPNPNTAPNPQTPPNQPPYPQNPSPEQPPVSPESKAGQEEAVPIPVAPQLTHVTPKKQKRYTGPKEFSVALKAAENRLAKAIVERAQASGQLAMLQAEIPSLISIINALKGQQNVPAVPYDFPQNGYQAPMPGFQSVGVPHQIAPANPLAAIQAAMAAPPVSRAVGNAVQFGPDVVGALEGPEDDDPDRFITGPNAGGGWIGG